jgi:hypothetical protein
MFRGCNSLCGFCESSTPGDPREHDAAAEGNDNDGEEQKTCKSGVCALRFFAFCVFDR